MHDSVGGELTDLNDQVDQSQRGSVEPAQNTLNAQSLHENSFSRIGGQLFLGRIILSLPYLNWYLVHLDGHADLPCSRGSPDSSNQSLGTRDASMLAPHATVLVAKLPRQGIGVILATVPEALYNSAASFTDWISQGSNVGYKREAYYRELGNILQEGGMLTDWGANRPGDAMAAGDWGRLSDLGGGVWVDSFMSFLRADDVTGFWAFYHDQLIRMSGHNLDIRSSGHETSVRDDQGEIQTIEGSTPYPWEAMGSYEPEGEVHREIGDEAVHTTDPYGKYEPKEDDQKPFYRFVELGGYLGQGHTRYLATLPEEKSGQHKYDKEIKIPGLFWEHVALDGSYSLASAKQVVIAKRALLPVPHQKRLAEDARESDADNEKDYKASGNKGGGKDHKIKDPKFADTEERRAIAGASLAMDMHAYLFGWQSLHPFHYHEKDYYVPKQNELGKLEKIQTEIKFEDLAKKGWLAPPEAKEVHIDHRYKEVKYFANTSGMHLLDDGGVLFTDGYGSEIRMSGGNIVISCPGSLFLQTGRSLVALGGDDICLRARNSFDISAAQKDVRIKAENNLQVLAGNSGTAGGMLFEVKSDTASQVYDKKVGEDVEGSGILFKVPKAGITTWSKDLYLRTGSKEGQIDGGDIVIDADKGKGRITTYSDSIQRFIQKDVVDFFGGKNVNAVNHYDKDRALIAGSVYAGGRLIAQGGATFAGGINVVGGHISTQFATGNKFVSPLKDAGLAAAILQLQAGTQLSQQKQTEGTTKYQSDLQQAFYETGKPGSAKLQQQAGFSFRNEEQYGTTEFVLPATRYQMMLDVTGGGGGIAWEEPVVKYQADELMPFPGKKRWKDEQALLMGSLKLFQPSQGYDTELGSEYEEVEFKKLEEKTMGSDYKVIE